MPIKTVRNYLLFILPSLLGVFVFLTPVFVDNSITIPIAVMKDMMLGIISDYVPLMLMLSLNIAAVLMALGTFFKPSFIHDSKFLNGLFNTSYSWFVLRLLGTLFVNAVYFEVGPEWLLNPNTGIFVFEELLPTLLVIFALAGVLLPFITHFGFLDFIGVLLTKFMRPLFNLPGRSAVDCIASWLGDGSVGILMSSTQYESKEYSEREASVIGTTFSAVSISFSLVVLSQVKLDHLFVPFYGVVCVTGILLALVVPKLPPLRFKKDVYIDGTPANTEGEAIPDNHTIVSYAMDRALHTVNEIPSVMAIVKVGLRNALDMVLAVIPVVMAVGTIGLIISEYSPVFSWLGMPFLPLLEWLQIPEATAASETIMVGFIDMFIPATLAASIESEFTRFVIAALSVVQLIFLSETGALLMGSKIPIKFWELFLIFLQRTLIALPIITLFAHWLF